MRHAKTAKTTKITRTAGIFLALAVSVVFVVFACVERGDLPRSRVTPLIRGPALGMLVVDALDLNATALLAIATLGISLMLLLVSIASYARLRNAKLLLTGGAFLLLALKGALWAWRSIVQREADVTGALLDFLVLGFLYASVAKR